MFGTKRVYFIETLWVDLIRVGLWDFLFELHSHPYINNQQQVYRQSPKGKYMQSSNDSFQNEYQNCLNTLYNSSVNDFQYYSQAGFAVFEILGMLLVCPLGDGLQTHPDTRESTQPPLQDTRMEHARRGDDRGKEPHRCKSPTTQHHTKTCRQQGCTWSTE